MHGWARDLRRGDLLELVEKANGTRRVRYRVGDPLSRGDHRVGWDMQMVGPSGDTIGKAVPYYDADIESAFHQLHLDNNRYPYGTRALLMVHITYDDGHVAPQPWVEGSECPVESFEGASFEYRGQVDARAAGLPPEELWAHQDELVLGNYRFVGAGGELRPSPRDSSSSRRRIRRFRGR